MPQLDFRKPRLFVDTALAPGETVTLERSQSNYLGNVLRLSAGETILVFNGRDGEFAATLDVVEPMGMETMVYFSVDGQEICGRVDPGSATGPGEAMRLYADMDRMHLIDPQSGAVL